MSVDNLPTASEILETHEEIEEAYDMKYRGTRVVSPRLRLRKIIEEAAEKEDTFGRAAFLLRKLITTHLFEDGNKRTGWVTARDYLARNDLEPNPRQEEVERVLRRIRRYDVDEIAEWLETGDIDRDRLNP